MTAFVATATAGAIALSIFALSELAKADSAVPETVVTDRVALIEINTCDTLSQLIFWDYYHRYDSDTGRWGPAMHVVDYRVIGFYTRAINVDHYRNAITFWDRKGGCRRRIVADAIANTVTTHDPEINDRYALPMSLRSRLSRPITEIEGANGRFSR